MGLLDQAGAAAPDNNVEWNGVSHVGWQDRRPLVPTGGESFQVRFQVYRADITAARLRVDDGAVQWVSAVYAESRGPYDIWSATVPATAANTLEYVIELTDGTDTDYYGPNGMSDALPATGFEIDFATLAHAPVGATPATQGVVFKVWSPTRTSVHVRGQFNGWGLGNPLTKVGEHFVGRVATAQVGQQYKYYFENAVWNTDARARALESLPDLNARVENPLAYAWSSNSFSTPPLEAMVIYQLHVGTFSGLNDPFGSVPFPARYMDVMNRVAHLVDLGINCVMLNPITEFPGDNSAGYNPQTMWAPESRYGNPTALKAMIDALHAAGIAVLVDVVWNHFTFNDNFMWNYDGTQLYFDTPALDTPWGSQADFDNEGVRDYFLHSGMYWLEEMRVDGFRFDGTDFIGVGPQAASGWSLMQEFNNIVDNRWADRVVIAEQLPDDPGITTPTASGGAGFDSQYYDNFTDRLREELLDAAFGDPEMWKIRDIINGGGPNLSGRRVVNYLELHDEAWPESGGQRLVKTIDPTAPYDDVWARGRIKLAQGLVLTAPGVPAILQGSEWLEDADFGANSPNRIDWAHKTTYADIFAYFKALIALRTSNPALRADAPHITHHLNESGNVIGFYRYDNGDNRLVVIANFSNTDYSNYRIGVPVPGEWSEILNSQASEFGGSGQVNPNTLMTDAIFADGFGQSVTITLPQMGFVILKEGALPTSVAEDVVELEGAPSLDGVFPSPSVGRTRIAYRLAVPTAVRITVHDARGRLVATLVDGIVERGAHRTEWNGLDAAGKPAPAGVYFARLVTSYGSATRKITFVR